MKSIEEVYEALRDIEITNPDFKDEVDVDKYNLDIDAAKQARLVLEWSVSLAQASAERDRLKDKLTVKKANLTIRAHQGECTGKSTDAGVKAWVECHPELASISEELIKAEEIVNLMFAAKGALEHKKAMIETISKLWLGGYYARPHVSKEALETAEKTERMEQLAAQHQRLVKRTLQKSKQ